jgi:hypothetical protein
MGSCSKSPRAAVCDEMRSYQGPFATVACTARGVHLETVSAQAGQCYVEALADTVRSRLLPRAARSPAQNDTLAVLPEPYRR